MTALIVHRTRVLRLRNRTRALWLLLRSIYFLVRFSRLVRKAMP